MTRKPIIVAHRGLHREFPENSAESFAAAFDAGFLAVECDIRMTADRVPILMHDETLDRTTTSSGHVAAAKWPDLQNARLRQDKRETGWRIPRLEDLFAASGAVEAKSRLLLIEQKVRDAGLTKLILDSRPGVQGHIILQSFQTAVLDDAKSIDAQADLALLCGKHEELAAAIESPYKRLHLSHPLLTRELVTRLHRADRSVGAWTANTEVELRGVMAVGVDVIITDQPVLARELLEA